MNPLKEALLIIWAALLVFVLGLILGENSVYEKTWKQCRETGTTSLTHGRSLSCAPNHIEPIKVVV